MSTVSLVMATYNGQQHIAGQLDSLRAQTRCPDEVLIFDDDSTDETAHTVRVYLKENNLTGWNFSVNEKNLGWRANFAQAIGRAEGELLFLSDQDDIWHPDKIERMVSVMEEHPEIKLLCTNADVIYEGSNVPESRLQFYSREALYKIPFSAAHLNVGRPGCTYCIRTAFAQKCMRDYWMPLLAHDALLWAYAVLHDGLYLLNEKTIDFMRYGTNASANGSRTKQFRIAAFDREMAYVEAYLHMVQESDMAQAERKRAVLQTIQEFQYRRVDFLKHPAVSGGMYLLRHIGCYQSYRNWLSDIYCALMT